MGHCCKQINTGGGSKPRPLLYTTSGELKPTQKGGWGKENSKRPSLCDVSPGCERRFLQAQFPSNKTSPLRPCQGQSGPPWAPPHGLLLQPQGPRPFRDSPPSNGPIPFRYKYTSGKYLRERLTGFYPNIRGNGRTFIVIQTRAWVFPDQHPSVSQ